MAEFTLKRDIDVTQIQSMGSDAMIAAAAWVSTTAEEGLKRALEKPDDVPGVINYLVKHRHGTPFEHSAITFCVKAPIFVWREWHRHRVGMCLSGKTNIWAESYAARSGRTIRKRPLAELHDLWHNGVTDNQGRTRDLASIKNQKLRVLNEQTGFFELGRIKDIFQSGIKECLRVDTLNPKRSDLRCSKDHRILTQEGWIKAGDLTGSEYIAVSGKRSAFEGRQIPPTLREGIGVWTSMQRGSLIKEVDRCYICDSTFSRDQLALDHVIPVVKDLQLALTPSNLKPICTHCHREKTNGEQILAQRKNVAGVVYSQLLRKPEVISEEMTYDIEMYGPHHNFVADGIIVHNSYNEESGRYKQLDPTFYVPDRERPMMKVDNWKPGRPKFTRCESDMAFDLICKGLESSYRLAYRVYEANLSFGIDPGLARDCLPVGIYSSCWVTCNPRSLMHFLSLRVHEPDATFVSYPLWEIDMAARLCEELFSTGWPITYAAFIKNGRVAP